MYVDHTETWDSLADSLLNHGTVATPSSGYNDPLKFIEHFLRGIDGSKVSEKFDKIKPVFLGWDDNHNDSSGAAYMKLQITGKFKNNQEAKELLEKDY